MTVFAFTAMLFVPMDAFSTRDISPPGAPTVFFAIPSYSQEHGQLVTLHWTAPSNDGGSPITDYIIRWGIFDEGFPRSSHTASDVTTITFPVYPDFSISFMVSAVNSEGTGTPTRLITYYIPSEPLNLTTIPGNSQVTLNWTEPNDNFRITDYTIQYKLHSTSLYTTFDDGISLNTSTTVTNLTNGESYDFRVFAVKNYSGTGPPTSIVSATPQLPPSTTPFAQNFDSMVSSLQSAVDERGVSGNVWTSNPPTGWSIDNSAMPAVSGTTEWQGWSIAEKSFWVSVAGDQQRSEFTKGTNLILIADPDEWDDRNAPSQSGTFNSTITSPNISVTAGNSLLLSFDSHYRQFASQRAQVIATFSDNLGTVISSQQILNYDNTVTSDNSGEDAQNQSVSLPIIIPATADTMTVSWKMYDAGNDWYWAIDNIEIREPSPPVQEIIPPAESPHSPNDLTAIVGDSQVTLNWTAPYDGGSPITSYYVWYFDSDGNKQSTYYNNSNGSTLTITDLLNGEEYRFKMASINSIGWSNASNEVTVTPPLSLLPPSNPNATDPYSPNDLTAIVGDSQVTLNWTEPDDGGSPIIQYYVWWFDSDGIKDSTRYDISNGTTLTITGLVNGEEYIFKMAAINSIGWSNASNEVLVTTSGPQVINPPPPIDVTATPGDNQIILNWTEPENNGSPITMYRVWWQESTGQNGVVTHTDPLPSTYNVPYVVNGVEYTISIRSVNADWNHSEWVTVHATPTP